MYTNNFFYTGFGSFAFQTTECTELYCDSTSRYIGEDLVKQFYPSAYLAFRRYVYDKAYWEQQSYPYAFAAKDSMLHDLEYHGPLEQQFIDEGKKE